VLAGPADASRTDGALATAKETSPRVAEGTAARISELQQQRAQLHLGRNIAGGAVGVGVALVGLSLIVQSLVTLPLREPCEDELGNDSLACPNRKVARALIYTGVGLHVAGAVIIGVTFPRIFSRARRYRALGREIKRLRAPQLSLGAHDGAYRVTWSARF
jgi:hypothetical protein